MRHFLRTSRRSRLRDWLGPLRRDPVSGGSRLYLKLSPTPYQSLRRAASPARARSGAALSPADRPYPSDCRPYVDSVLDTGVLPRDAWHRRLGGSSQQPGVSPRRRSHRDESRPTSHETRSNCRARSFVTWTDPRRPGNRTIWVKGSHRLGARAPSSRSRTVFI